MIFHSENHRYDNAVRRSLLNRVKAMLFQRDCYPYTALPLLAEVGDFSRFRSVPQFAAYLGLVLGEHSSSDKQHRTGITKAGNSHLRRLLIESAHCYSRGAVGKKSKAQKERQAGNSPEVIAYADRAADRLKRKYQRIALHSRSNIAKTAVARELACFIWGMMTEDISCENPRQGCCAPRSAASSLTRISPDDKE